MSMLQPDTHVLFIGDSITDAGRDRSDPDHLGGGYAALVAAYAQNPTADQLAKVRFANRGISGNRVRDLRARWQTDCLDLAPDVVSIMIGINDTWRRYDSGDATSVDDFARDYDEILSRTRDNVAALLLVEPFLLPVRPEQHGWREDLDPKIAVVHTLAERYSATLVPLDTLLTQAAGDVGPAALAGDGVHPTPEGHALIARHWLAAAGAEVTAD
ncbi:MAG TPA: SGNH/GDSL hydrolase family protein [Actinopolymorphaceae bacterium]|jgi:lysophospholipase L1-like esterase|nr:SGNH/GDSL hydrolase family protein [Actinopolymorphaceae bacterium]